MHVEDGTAFNHLSVDTTEEFFDRQKNQPSAHSEGYYCLKKP